ncbi:prepilin peptidase [Planobispora takensis]|uniref:Prepilin peptidase n=1 Tax=Planobispora takensis TaxID=1367882 RepID=A0A8J3T652_9ACTN|nr:A24 family peptidase [Planobispora takensis]GII05886.1 prepilin peptidase [Planobispora takensis]
MALLPVAAALAGLLIGLFSRALVVRHSAAGGEALRYGCPLCTALLVGALTWKAVAGDVPPGNSSPAGASPAGASLGGAELTELLAFCWLAVLCVVLAFVDLAVRRLPDRFTLAAGLGTGTLLTIAAAAGGRWGDLLGAGLGGLALAAFYLLLFLVNPAGMGLGDVKLAAVLGIALGWLGWDVLVTGAFLGFLAGALYGVALIVLRRGNRKSEFPFGPFMIIGAFAAVLITP